MSDHQPTPVEAVLDAASVLIAKGCTDVTVTPPEAGDDWKVAWKVNGLPQSMTIPTDLPERKP